MAEPNSTRIINDTNDIIAKVQLSRNLFNIGCGILPLVGMIMFALLVVYFKYDLINSILTTGFVLFLATIATILVSQGIEAWFVENARRNFNSRFPAKLRPKERQIAIEHLADIGADTSGIKELLKKLGYKAKSLETPPENQLNEQLQQLATPAEKIQLAQPHPAKPTKTATPVSESPKPIKSKAGKKIIPLDPYEDDI